ncbi:MAG: trypsin-like peptidase domain-containing protein [Candidatus Acidiferrum sp.]
MNISGLGEIAERVRRYTVLVQHGGRGSGSGVIWSSDGLIVTNAHVARASRVAIGLWDGREFTAEVSARDSRRDLAALRISATGLSSAVAADSSRVRPGEVAIAVGNPLGFLGAMTMGVVHAVAPLHGLGEGNWVQADVRLAPGNSGGPLADVHGRVIGINTMVAGRLALAIPSNEVSRFLLGDTGGHWLGVTVTRVRLPRPSQSQIGLVLLGIEPGSPAAMASLLPGDILLGTEETAFSSVQNLAEALQNNSSGILRLKFLRGDYGKVRRVSISLAGRRRGSIAA